MSIARAKIIQRGELCRHNLQYVCPPYFFPNFHLTDQSESLPKSLRRTKLNLQCYHHYEISFRYFFLRNVYYYIVGRQCKTLFQFFPLLSPCCYCFLSFYLLPQTTLAIRFYDYNRPAFFFLSRYYQIRFIIETK